MTTTQPELDFDGRTYRPELDRGRLNKQLNAVRTLMSDGLWRTLAEIEHETGFPQASVSARLRDLRKSRFGNHTVNRRRRSQGLYEYSVGVSA